MNTPKYLLIAIVLVAIIGCTLRPNLVTAYVKESGEVEVVEVTLRSSDAKAIKDREIYFSIVVTDCENKKKQFPIQPYVADQLASKFDFPIEGEYITLYGSIPQRILSDYSRPCIFLRGGSYIFGKIESAPIRLVRLQ